MQTAAEKLGVDILNTRLVCNHPCIASSLCLSSVRKDADGFTLLVASAEAQETASHDIEVNGSKASLKVEYGDFSDALNKAAAALKEVGTLCGRHDIKT